MVCPLHPWSCAIFEPIGDEFGGFRRVEANIKKYVSKVKVVVREEGIIPKQIFVCDEHSHFCILVMVELTPKLLPDRYWMLTDGHPMDEERKFQGLQNPSSSLDARDRYDGGNYPEVSSRTNFEIQNSGPVRGSAAHNRVVEAQNGSMLDGRPNKEINGPVYRRSGFKPLPLKSRPGVNNQMHLRHNRARMMGSKPHLQYPKFSWLEKGQLKLPSDEGPSIRMGPNDANNGVGAQSDADACYEALKDPSTNGGVVDGNSANKLQVGLEVKAQGDDERFGNQFHSTPVCTAEIFVESPSQK
ncbi:hypothetical protein F0562_032376 [Nyssa sinensis]|uniref:Uncharacterized protein n=1 Tax=Nyssa sinensis TaxID=561372 RepID=A0A5J5AQ41_9ASTE|nr:hypothetical protein F0562_032376 [Nyssa sinensis]